MSNITVEQIVAELERNLASLREQGYQSSFAEGRESAYESILDFIYDYEGNEGE